MSREEALEKALEELKEIRFNLNYKVNGTSRFDEALNMAIEALEAESRMHLVQEAVNAIINTCNTDSITDKAMRNAAKFVQNAIDGSYPEFEKLEQDLIPCSERLLGETDVIFSGSRVHYELRNKTYNYQMVTPFDNHKSKEAIRAWFREHHSKMVFPEGEYVIVKVTETEKVEVVEELEG